MSPDQHQPTDAEWEEFLATLPWLSDAEQLFRDCGKLPTPPPDQAHRALMAFVETWGTEAMDMAVFAWVDQLGHALGVTAGPNARQFPPGEFFVTCGPGGHVHDVEPGQLGDMAPVYEWVREMINARFRMDQAEWMRLRTQLAERAYDSDLKLIIVYLGALPVTCAQTYRQAITLGRWKRASQN